MHRSLAAPRVLLAALCVCGSLSAQTPARATKVRDPQPAFNLFSVSQDIEMGRQSAAQAEKELPLLNNARVNTYLTQLVQKLAANAPGARYPYSVKGVNSSEVNAFSLPGGPMYVNVGLIKAARSEAELAGVLSHEMAHVALRHGTSQASNTYLAQTGLGLLGGLLGKKSSTTASLVSSLGGAGLNLAFLKFSRDDEYEADEVGAQIMARSGYDPAAMADFFGYLRQQQGRDPSKLERFLSDHPASADREAKIRNLATTLSRRPSSDVGGFSRIQSVATNQSLATTSSAWPTEQPAPAAQPVTAAPVTIRIAQPSSRFLQLRQKSDFFTISYPDNWRPYSTAEAFALTIAPEGGVIETNTGQQTIAYGVVINHYAPFEGTTGRWASSLQRNYTPFESRTPPRGSLEDATDDLVRQILKTNPYLRATNGSAKSELIDGAVAYSVMLKGVSPVTGQEETVKAFTRGLPDNHVIYALCIAPTRDYDALDRTFQRMIRTLIVNEDAVHGQTVAANR